MLTYFENRGTLLFRATNCNRLLELQVTNLWDDDIPNEPQFDSKNLSNIKALADGNINQSRIALVFM